MRKVINIGQWEEHLFLLERGKRKSGTIEFFVSKVGIRDFSLLWRYNLGTDIFYKIFVHKSGTVYLLGLLVDVDEGSTISLIKLSKDGEFLQKYDLEFGLDMFLYLDIDLVVDNEGNVYLAGNTNRHPFDKNITVNKSSFIVMYNSKLERQWLDFFSSDKSNLSAGLAINEKGIYWLRYEEEPYSICEHTVPSIILSQYNKTGKIDEEVLIRDVSTSRVKMKLATSENAVFVAFNYSGSSRSRIRLYCKEESGKTEEIRYPHTNFNESLNSLLVGNGKVYLIAERPGIKDKVVLRVYNNTGFSRETKKVSPLIKNGRVITAVLGNNNIVALVRVQEGERPEILKISV